MATIISSPVDVEKSSFSRGAGKSSREEFKCSGLNPVLTSEPTAVAGRTRNSDQPAQGQDSPGKEGGEDRVTSSKSARSRIYTMREAGSPAGSVLGRKLEENQGHSTV